jgi:hypothetical protein
VLVIILGISLLVFVYFGGTGKWWLLLEQCEKEIYSPVYKKYIKCGQTYGMTYNSWSYFDYKYAKSVVDNAMADHQDNDH